MDIDLHDKTNHLLGYNIYVSTSQLLGGGRGGATVVACFRIQITFLGKLSVSQLNGSYQIFSLGSELVSKRFSFYGINEVVFISICFPGKELSALIKTIDIHGILLKMQGKLGYNKFILMCLRIIYCYPRKCRENSVNS